ncbi:MAG: type I polyketide synthase, partial [Planctomycetota bacterium]
MSSTSDRIARLSPEKLAMLKRALGKANDSSEPIAVVGMGCRFPQARSIEDYWQIIQESRIVTGEVPPNRWNADSFFDPDGGLGKMITRWGGFVDDVDRFDATFFGVSPREAERMDPQQRLLLEVVWQAMEYGALVPADYRGSRTGVFVGVGGVDYSRIPVQLDDYYEQITAYSGTGNALSIVSNRISYTLDLRGPSLSVDTACSSSLVAAHMAIRSLRSGESDAAIVGGVNLILTPETTLAFSQAQMLSRTGQCRPFDADAAGYVRGEGCGAVILKRLSDAEAAGDMVLAVIRGSAVNQDGRTSGIAAPNGPSQESCIHEALKDAGLTPDDVTYVEAHGTGTPLGDPIEVEALSHVFRRQSDSSPDCYFGSVKANIGHTETVAGMASLIKLVLLLQHGRIPRQAHYESLNPHIRLDGSRLKIAEQSIDWSPESATRIAGVSSFGFGGTNAHLVMEQASESENSLNKQSQVPSAQSLGVEAGEATDKQLYVVSAKTEEDLTRMAGVHAEFLRKFDGPIAEACYNSTVGRSHFGHRAAVTGNDPQRIAELLQEIADGKGSRGVKRGTARSSKRLRVAFLFTGQGSQQIGMGRELYEKHSVFRKALDECDQILVDMLPQRLLDVLWQDGPDAWLHQTQYTQPALFAIEYSLAQLWKSVGVEPAVVLGHSVGEFAAACTAGVFSLEDGLRLIAHRARLMQSLPKDGAMVVVFATRDQVAQSIQRFGDSVSIGVHNGPISRRSRG